MQFYQSRSTESANFNKPLDTEFNQDGKLISYRGVGYSVIQQQDGKLVVAGDKAIARYHSTDSDTDGDGLTDYFDCFPLDPSEWLDADQDGVGNNSDPDDDNDEIPDSSDAFPTNPTESADADGDNLGDNSDPLPDDASTLNNYLGKIKSDKYGSSVSFAGDFNNDGYGDYIIGIPGFDVSSKIKDAGRAEVISGKNGDVLAFINGTAAKDALGTAVAGGGDIDNDGYDDVVIGAPNAGATGTGTVILLYGPLGAVTQTIGLSSASTGSISVSLNKGAGFGAAVALGDVDGDSHYDLIIGAPKADVMNWNLDSRHLQFHAGAVLVYSGKKLYRILSMLYGESAKANAGSSVAVGDVNSDGNADIIVGAPNDGGVGSVTVYNQFNTQLFKASGTSAKSQFGKSVACGNVNNDGFDDVIVGAPGDDNGVLKDVGSVTVLSANGGTQLTKQFGSTAKANLGNSVAAGDVNDDGYADIIAGAWKDDKPGTKFKDTGSVSVFSGNGFSQIGTTKYGDAAKDYFGSAVSAGDINSDGKDDVIIGIPGFDLPATKPIKDAGKVQVLSGAGL